MLRETRESRHYRRRITHLDIPILGVLPTQSSAEHITATSRPSHFTFRFRYFSISSKSSIIFVVFIAYIPLVFIISVRSYWYALFGQDLFFGDSLTSSRWLLICCELGWTVLEIQAATTEMRQVMNRVVVERLQLESQAKLSGDNSGSDQEKNAENERRKDPE
jgi:hypothetical protein